MHIQVLSQRQTPAAPPDHNPSVHNSSPVPSCIFPPISRRGLQKQSPHSSQQPASASLLVLAQPSLAKPSPHLALLFPATEVNGAQTQSPLWAVGASHLLPLQIGSLPEAPGQKPASSPWEPSSSFPNTEQPLCSLQRSQHLSTKGGATPKGSRSTAASIGMSVAS